MGGGSCSLIPNLTTVHTVQPPLGPQRLLRGEPEASHFPDSETRHSESKLCLRCFVGRRMCGSGWSGQIQPKNQRFPVFSSTVLVDQYSTTKQQSAWAISPFFSTHSPFRSFYAMCILKAIYNHFHDQSMGVKMQTPKMHKPFFWKHQ